MKVEGIDDQVRADFINKNKVVFDQITNFIIEAKDWADTEEPDLDKLKPGPIQIRGSAPPKRTRPVAVNTTATEDRTKPDPAPSPMKKK